MADLNHEPDVSSDRFSLKHMLSQAGTWIFVIFVGVVIVFFFYRMAAVGEAINKLLKILAPVIAGLVIAYVLMPIVTFLERHLLYDFGMLSRAKNPKHAQQAARGIGVLIALVGAFGMILILGYLVVPGLVSSVREIVIRLPEYSRRVVTFFDQIKSDGKLSQDVKDIVNQAMNYFQNWLRTDFYPQLSSTLEGFTASVMGLMKFVYNILIGAIISIYVMMSHETFQGQSKKVVFGLFKPEIANSIIDVFHHTNSIFSGFITGKLIDSAIIGVLCFIGVTILNMPYAMLVSVIVGVTNIIPFFGPYIGAIPSILLIALVDFKKALIFGVFIVLLQQFDGNILGPKILGDSTGLSPFWVVFAILTGGGLFGIAGMLLGVPVFAIIYYLVKTFIEYLLYNKNLPMESSNYVNVAGYDEEEAKLITYAEEEKRQLDHVEKGDGKGIFSSFGLERFKNNKPNEKKKD